ncbi:hypothetical protein GL50803_0032686 [Giardia duodenalis]|uniref:Uncharacterized protein n=1 Tax=Giardia intestinalis (strain ATCC 50803 / WB clone C6) TaxID=184922 RepID=A8BSN3_GIAIC|nr:hypothetical protein GL50803_0032686 [Giardia intestinalis]KAE8305512.1 hypothetical protein GL50803_0032686 [Giardia intestinalis]|eukprot:XP_001705035.1 Hypothetical protein GL50803_32686 [Giardia lamblia ATCC 50803]
MSEYDEHAPVFSGSGTDLMTELSRELTSPLFRQLPPGLITSARNLRRSTISAIPGDGDMLPVFKDIGSNGSTPSSHSSSLKASRIGLNDPPSINVSLSSSSGKRSMGCTFYRPDMDHVFELPQVDNGQLFRDDFMPPANLGPGQNQQGIVKHVEQRIGTSLGSDSNSAPDNTITLVHDPDLPHDHGPASDPKLSLTLGINTMPEENNGHQDYNQNQIHEHDQLSISELGPEDHSIHIPQRGRSASNKREYLIIPQETRERLIHMVCIDGMNVQSAVKQLNLKYSAAINIVRKFRDCGQLEVGPRGRRSKKVVSPEMHSTIAAILAEHPKIEVTELRQMLKAKGISLPPSLIKDAAANIRRQQMDVDVY